jgi:pimeloyl-ACP methyl ester carboxylesterase
VQLVFVHSPYLGPSSWRRTAAEMSAVGYAVQVPDLRESVRREPCASSFIAAACAAVDRASEANLVLIGHSRAGPLLPTVAWHRQPRIAAVLYVDAALPHPGRSWADRTSPERVSTMRQLGISGSLPRWSDWWDPSAIEELVPDPAMRKTLIDEMPCVATSFLDERLPNLDWEGPVGYLQLSDPYTTFAETARNLGWPVETCALGHLAILTAPSEVATGGIVRLLTSLQAKWTDSPKSDRQHPNRE